MRERCDQSERTEELSYRDKLMQRTKKELVDTIIQLQQENTDLTVRLNDREEKVCIARSGVFQFIIKSDETKLNEGSKIQLLAKKILRVYLKYLGITEHAPKMPGTCHLFYFENLKDTI